MTNWRKLYSAAGQGAERQAREYRALVFEYADLKARLAKPPIGYASPEAWNGYIAPAMEQGHAWFRSHRPRRTELLALVHEALGRKHGREVADGWLAEINVDRWSGPWTPHAAAEGN